MNALVIEGEHAVAARISCSLADLGLLCAHCADGKSGLGMLLSGDYCLAIADTDLEGISGIELIRRAREHGDKTPIIVLSKRNSVGDRVCGLNIGADDYLAKPFSPSELKARVNALLRRTGMEHRRNLIAFGDLVLNTLEHKARRNERELMLTMREFEILEYLVRNANRTVSINMILQEVWGCSTAPSTTVVETRICHLRKKLCLGGEAELIHTVRGFGYVLRRPLPSPRTL